MRNKNVNNQGVKLKNHKFWSVNSPPGAEFSLAQKLMQTWYLFIIIVFICDLFVSRDDPLMS